MLISGARLGRRLIHLRSLLLGLVLLLSGTAALIFQIIWFRQASFVFGSTLWAAAMVLSAFMSGLALGNALAAMGFWRVWDPLQFYVKLELMIGVFGLALVMFLPFLPQLLAPLWIAMEGSSGLAGVFRFGTSFLLMLIPTTAMGLTLPIMVRSLSQHDKRFVKVLGSLYGWNTAGAVLGVLLTELWLLQSMGLVAAGMVAAALNFIAAFGANTLRRLFKAGFQADTPPPRQPSRWPGLAVPALPVARLLTGAFLTGFILLGLEILWFRFLFLFSSNTNASFGIMLAVVLLGIASGGFAGAQLPRFKMEADRYIFLLFVLSCAAVLFSYRWFTPTLIGDGVIWYHGLLPVGILSASLMFPAAFLSGCLFTVLGQKLQHHVKDEIRTTGLLTLANTTGSLLGPLAAAFLVLPYLGIERGFVFFGLAYVLAGLIVVERKAVSQRGLAWPSALAVGLAGLILWFLPLDKMPQHLEQASSKYRQGDNTLTVAVREGQTETIQLLRTDFLGEPMHFRLMTNGYSMSATTLDSMRYMKYYVWLPLALHDSAESALLISFGVGTTAKALVDTPWLRRIDIVDISRDILAMSDIVYAGTEHPLHDERVEVTIEDGRHYLLTRERGYDVITAEPPPPMNMGVINLYTLEYFRLLKRRLNPGGIVSYWLPVDQMPVESAKAILSAFCEVFTDCSLWSGSTYNWMMLGTNGLESAPELSSFTRQWNDPRVLSELQALGFEIPPLLGTPFIADHAQLKPFIGTTQPLSDLFPGRLAHRAVSEADFHIYYEWIELTQAERRFRNSNWIQRIWPKAMLEATASYYPVQPILNKMVRIVPPERIQPLKTILTETNLVTPILWLIGTDYYKQKIINRHAATLSLNDYSYWLALRYLTLRDYEQAHATLDGLGTDVSADITELRILTDCLRNSVCP